MRLATATLVGTLLFAASSVLLVVAREATDAMAIAGGTGVVISGAMLGLTYLAWGWRRSGVAAYVQIEAEDSTSVYEELAVILEPDVHARSGFEDAAAV